MPEPVLTTKLYIPPPRSHLVPRPRLIERLNNGLRGPLTLVSAPAGYGKTTLVSEWHISKAGGDLPVAWLSLDEDDNNPTRFLTYLLAAIGTLKQGFGEFSLASLNAPQPPPPHMWLTNLINELSELENPFTLVLDDYHIISTQAIHEALAFILDHLPVQMHLVILSRSDPPLPLARLRARNQLTEIRAIDLRFSPDEALLFLNSVMGLGLSKDDISELERRTEGWVAGLQLAALSLHGREDPTRFIATFGAGSYYIVDYLVEEVLNRQPESLRQFLLQTSILSRLNGPLCDAVTSQIGGLVTLEQLERSNLFVTPMGGESSWYRYHHLFADVMQNRLCHLYPDQIPGLHIRASEWFEKNGFTSEAIHHALDGGDRDRAGRLAEQLTTQMLARGELVALLGMLNRIADLVKERPWLCIDKAWALMLTGQIEKVEILLQQAEQLTDSLEPEENARQLRGNIAAIRCFLAARGGDAQAGLELGKQALDILPENNPGVRGVVYMAMGGAFILNQDTGAAIHAMLQASRLGELAGNSHVAVTAIATVANLLMAQGQLHHSEKILRDTLQKTISPDGSKLPIAARIYSGLSRLYYAWNDLDQSQEFCQQALEFGQKWGNVDTLVTAHVMLSRIRQARGDEQGAEESMCSAEDVLRSYQLTSTTVEWVELWRVWLWIAQGNLAACERWMQADQLSSSSKSTPSEGKQLIKTRILLAQHNHDQALELFTSLLSANEAIGHWESVIEILVYQALAYQQANQTSQALSALGRALSLARDEGYVRVFLDEGEPIAQLLRLAASKGIEPKYVTRLLSERNISGKVISTPQQPLIEPLSERELEVIQLVARGNSNQEIAAQLVISTGTVKSHLSHIFNKLNVDSRTQCVARARELKLIP